MPVKLWEVFTVYPLATVYGLPRPRRSVPCYTTFAGNSVKKAEEIGGTVFVDEQFKQHVLKLSLKAVLLLMLLLIGCVIGLTMRMRYSKRPWPLFILCIIMLIPVSYYIYVLLTIALRREGFFKDGVPVIL